jgi:hypothetical protein
MNALQVSLLGFERCRYRLALETLKDQLYTLASEKEEERFNRLWLIAVDALDSEKMAVSAAKQGLFRDMFE